MPKEPILPKELHQISQPTGSSLDNALKLEAKLATVGRYLEDLGRYHRENVQASIALDSLRDVHRLVKQDILQKLAEVRHDERMLKKIKMVQQISEYKFFLWSDSKKSELKDFKPLVEHTSEFCKSKLHEMNIKLPGSD